MKYFLLVYDRPRGELVGEPREFADHAAALRARFEIELHHPSNRDHEVIVLGGESLDALAQTHARYFRRSAEPVA